MFNDLDPIIREAIIKILAAVYESGLLASVDLRHVVKMFGAVPENVDTDPSAWIVDFDDPAFIEAYVQFKEEELLRMNEVQEYLNNDISDDEAFAEIAYDEYLSGVTKKHNLH